jgi:hypothetical protein
MQLVGEPIASAIARIKALKQADRVILRGQSFFAEGPLEYKDYQLEHKRKGFPKESVELTTSRKDIGFRVVIHPEDRAGSPP